VSVAVAVAVVWLWPWPWLCVETGGRQTKLPAGTSIQNVCVCVSVCVCVLVCRPVGDKLLDINDLERFLRENLKVQGKTGNLVHVLYVCLCLCLCLSVFVGGGAGECVLWKLLFA